MTGAGMHVLLLHGWQNRRPPEHWQHWLATELRARGHAVAYPQLPDPDSPSLDAWLTALDGELTALDGHESVVLCHSLSCLLWLHHAARDAATPAVDRVLLVAPPSPGFAAGQPPIAAFVPPPVGAAELARRARRTDLVASDGDPYCPETAAAAFGGLGARSTMLTGAAHLNVDAGYGPWPAVLDWVLHDGPLRVR